MKKVLYLLITLFLTLPIGAQAQYDLGPYSELLKEGTEKDLMRLVAAIDNDVEAIQRNSETKYDELELRLKQSFAPRRQAIAKLRPEIWENDYQFEERKNALSESLETDLENELKAIANGIAVSYEAKLNSYSEIRAEALDRLETLKSEKESILVKSLGYDRNTRVWSFSMTFTGKFFYVSEFPFTIVFQPVESIDQEEFKSEIISFEKAVTANCLQPTLSWNFTYSEEHKDFRIRLLDFEITNPINGMVYKSEGLSNIDVKAYRLSGSALNDILIEEQEVLGKDSLNPEESPSRKLYVYTRIGSLFDSLIAPFEQANNIDVIFDYYETDEEQFAKLMTSGNNSYDLLLASSDYVSIMKNLGIIQKIDLSDIPNLKYVSQKVTDIFDHDPGMSFSVPFSISASGIAINSRKISLNEIGWDIFSNPKYRYRMILLDDMREVFGIAMASLGYSVNTQTPDEIEKAKNHILTYWKPNIIRFGDSTKSMIGSGDAWVAQTPFEDIVEKLSGDELGCIDFYLPQEGGNMNLMSMCIPIGAENYEFALKLIDFVHDPRTYARFVDRYLLPSIVNTDADKYRTTQPKYTLNELKNFQVTKDIGTALELYNNAWELIRYIN